VHRILVGEPVGKRPLGRPRRRWDGNVNLYPRHRSAEDSIQRRALLLPVLKLPVLIPEYLFELLFSIL
jgi:hypothetical protein